MKPITLKRKGTIPIIQVQTDNIPYLWYPALADTGIVKHCFSTRLGGVSQGIYESMNLSYLRGDEKEAVDTNFRRIAEAIHVDPKDYVFTDQTHTANVRIVTEADRGKGFLKERDYTDVDGLVTNVPDLVLSTFYADCVPLYFVDPVKKAIGLSHSGWKGTVNRIGASTIKTMTDTYGSDPKDIIAAIGPSICMECYEIGEEVAKEFKRGFSKEQADELLFSKGNEKYQLDLWRANEIILEEAGVLPENISTTDVCTCCNAAILFSHRASKGKRGNLGAFLCLK
jgi:YfiH family protein